MSKDYVRFVITGDARTGSNMLVHALNTNPAIRCFREIFHYWMNHVDYYVDGYDSQSREHWRCASRTEFAGSIDE